LWRELEAADRRTLREAKPELVVTVVQARNLPVRDRCEELGSFINVRVTDV